MAATDARPVPRKNAAFRFYFAIRKNDGTLITSWTGQDSEVSLDGAAFADCTSEATEIGTTGCGYLDLTAAEMNADAVVLKITVTNTNALPLVVTLFPEESGDYRVAAADVRSAVGLASANLDTQLTAIDDFLDTEVAAIKAKTDNLPSDPADQSAVEAAITAATSPLATAASLATVAGYLDTEIAAILADTNELQTDWANGGRLDLILDVIELWTKRNAVLVTGLLTGAGTNTEVYTISALGITATCTTDSSGNRSAVVWS